MRWIFILTCFSLCFASCSVYRQQFDCPPDPGTPCTSVTDLEQMVVETPQGPDIFLGCNDCASPLGSSSRRSIWINSRRCGDGSVIPGHYIYIR